MNSYAENNIDNNHNNNIENIVYTNPPLQEQNLAKGSLHSSPNTTPNTDVVPEELTVSKVDVRIMDEDYVLQGNADSDYILSLASYINSKTKEVKELCPNISDKKAAILTAINICDDLFQAKNYIDTLPKEEELKKIASKTSNMISLLDHSIVGLFE